MAIRRLFIDPGSKSTGWALFTDDELVIHGTVLANPKKDIHGRNEEISTKYRELVQNWIANDLGPSEVHMENVPYVASCHKYVHRSIGAIGSALAPYLDNKTIKEDVQVKTWQRIVEWNQKALKAVEKKAVRDFDSAREAIGAILADSVLAGLENEVDSIDELAAIGMGVAWFAEREFKLKGAKSDL